MSEITVRSQEELDALKPFETLTTVFINAKDIVIKEDIKNATIVLIGNSSAVFFNNSVAWFYSYGNAQAYENAVIFTNQNNVKAYDNATIKPLEVPTVSFEEWISRGWVVADGIYRKLVSQKTIGEISVYETDKGFVVKKGDKFSHGETAEKAIEDLRYKIADRDSSKFSAWKLDDVKSTDELIEAYRVITGACEMGVREFCGRTPLAEKMTVMDAIKITENHYGANQFKSFFMKGSSE